MNLEAKAVQIQRGIPSLAGEKILATFARALINNDGTVKLDANEIGAYAATLLAHASKAALLASLVATPTLAIAAGTAYSLTGTAAALNFGTTDPVLVPPVAGTYILFPWVNLLYNAATFAANQAVALKLRRTNNTPGDLSNSSVDLTTDIITTLTGTFAFVQMPPVVYTTSNTDDAITIFGSVDVAPSAGSLDAVAAGILAHQIK